MKKIMALMFMGIILITSALAVKEYNTCEEIDSRMNHLIEKTEKTNSDVRYSKLMDEWNYLNFRYYNECTIGSIGEGLGG